MRNAVVNSRMENTSPPAGGPGRTNKDFDLDGPIDGDADGRKITVLEGTTLRGEVGAQSIVIHGVVLGIVRALSITVRSTAFVEGEIQYETLTVDPGARIEARCVPIH